jgi:hypothetical protein
MDIIRRNFFRLLRAGVMDEANGIEPMSSYKWQRLAELLRQQNVVALAVRGLQSCHDDKRMNMPEALREELFKEAESQQCEIFDTEARLSNPLLNSRLKHIREAEPHVIDTNMETVRLLDLIVANINHIMNKGLSLQGILQIGLYLRTQGQHVDFVKLDKWLSRLHITRMASLLGNLLVEVFEFETEEVPFIRKADTKASKQLLRTLQGDNSSPSTSGQLFLFQPLESSTRLVKKIKQQLEEIEE